MKVLAVVWAPNDHQPELVAVDAGVADGRLQQMFHLRQRDVMDKAEEGLNIICEGRRRYGALYVLCVNNNALSHRID